MRKENRNHYMGNKHVNEINLKSFFELMKRRIWIIAVITIIAGGAGYFYSYQNYEPLYQTSTRVIVDADSGYMQTLMVMIKDPIVMEKVKNELALSRPSSSIANQIDVTRLEESQVISISVIDSDAKTATNIANKTAEFFKSEIAKILDFKDVQLLSVAEVNDYPINETQNRIVIIAIVFGLITGTGLVFLLDSLDSTVKSEQEVEAILGVPVLGVVSNMNKKKLILQKSMQNEIQIRGETIGSK